MTKGKPIFIEGRLRYESWEAKDGGGKRSKISVHIDNFQFIGGRDDGAKDGGEKQQQRQQSRPAQVVADAPDLNEQQFDEADIPF
jgi:single-strand DNA-binding protein